MPFSSSEFLHSVRVSRKAAVANDKNLLWLLENHSIQMFAPATKNIGLIILAMSVQHPSAALMFLNMQTHSRSCVHNNNNNTMTTQRRWATVSDALVVSVLEWLEDVAHVARARRVCKAWSSVPAAEFECLYKRLVVRDFPSRALCTDDKQSPSWCAAYRCGLARRRRWHKFAPASTRALDVDTRCRDKVVSVAATDAALVVVVLKTAPSASLPACVRAYDWSTGRVLYTKLNRSFTTSVASYGTWFVMQDFDADRRRLGVWHAASGSEVVAECSMPLACAPLVCGRRHAYILMDTGAIGRVRLQVGKRASIMPPAGQQFAQQGLFAIDEARRRAYYTRSGTSAILVVVWADDDDDNDSGNVCRILGSTSVPMHVWPNAERAVVAALNASSGVLMATTVGADGIALRYGSVVLDKRVHHETKAAAFVSDVCDTSRMLLLLHPANGYAGSAYYGMLDMRTGNVTSLSHLFDEWQTLYANDRFAVCIEHNRLASARILDFGD
jgi:hypothetical protein